MPRMVFSRAWLISSLQPAGTVQELRFNLYEGVGFSVFVVKGELTS